MKKIYLLLILSLFSAQGFAGSCPDGSDPIKSVSDDGTYYVYKCGGGNTNKTNSTNDTSSSKGGSSTKGSEIKIYDVAFSSDVLEELLNRIVSKLDYDFSKHKLATNIADANCRFNLRRIEYDKSESGVIGNWSMATGFVNIKDSNVDFVNASWRQAGLSVDPSYFKDETNIKLTADGHFVGKMAYFSEGVKKGQVPVNPTYVTLIKHQRSKTATFKDNKIVEAKYFIDVEDWAGGVLFISNCKDGNLQTKKPKPAKKEVTKVVTKEKSTESKAKKVTPTTQASTSESDPVISKVVEVTHGDKLVVNIAEPHELADNYIKVNLRDIDAPDATKSCPKQLEFGIKVRDYVSKRLKDATTIKLTNIRKTNTRLIAQVIVDGKDLGGELVEMGYASEEYGYWKPYYCSALTAVQAGMQLFDKDPDMSIFWLERSLILDPDGSNNTKSTYLLSKQYERMGEEKISIDYLKKSASIGWIQAMEELGQLYLNGIRVKQDKNQGKKWLKKAHDKGSQFAESLYCYSLPVAKQNTCKL